MYDGVGLSMTQEKRTNSSSSSRRSSSSNNNNRDKKTAKEIVENGTPGIESDKTNTSSGWL
jgi:hypothetical protein